MEPFVGIGEDPGFNAQECTKKTLTNGPFGNTCEEDEVSPEVEAGRVAWLRCLQPSWDTDMWLQHLIEHFSQYNAFIYDSYSHWRLTLTTDRHSSNQD